MHLISSLGSFDLQRLAQSGNEKRPSMSGMHQSRPAAHAVEMQRLTRMEVICSVCSVSWDRQSIWEIEGKF